jgi:hypothetical protein
VSAHPSIRKLIYRFTGTASSVGASTVLTVSGVPKKGHIAGIHVTTSSGTVTPLLSSDSAAASTHINKILEFDSALDQPEVPTQPIYYEAHDDSGTLKIYLKPVTSTSATVNYRIDIWAAA